MARLKLQPFGRQDKGKEPESRAVPTKEAKQEYRRMNFIKGLDDTVEMRIKPIAPIWDDDCVWIRCGKIERKVKRANLHKYPDHEIITYRT